MKNMLQIAVRPLLLVATLCGPTTPCVCCGEENSLPKPNPHIQKWIEHTVTLKTQPEITNEISRIRAEGYGVRDIIRQVLCFQVTSRRLHANGKISGDEVETKVLVADGLTALLLDWDRDKQSLVPKSRDALIDAVLPYIETSDSDLRHQAVSALRWIDQTTGSKKDFTGYESYLQARKGDLPYALIKYMYDRDPQAAMLSMSRVHADKTTEAEVAAQLKGDPKAALQSLADRTEWWAHLYVTEMMKKQPQLRDPAILRKLESDRHPLVREATAELKTKP